MTNFSAEAHESIKYRKEVDYVRILNEMDKHPEGMTYDDAVCLLKMLPQTASPRFAELKAKGWIVQAGEHLTRWGRKAGSWKRAPNEEQINAGLATPTR